MVKMPGEDADSASGAPDEFLSQPWYRRLIIAIFGPLMNYLLAILLFTVVIFNWGLSKPSALPVIGETIADYPAQQAGLAPGDKILKINSSAIASWEEMSGFIRNHPEEKLTITVDRQGTPLTVTIVPKKDPASGVGLIGIAPQILTEKVGFGQSVNYGTRMVAFQSYYTLKYLGEKLVKWEKPELAGPIGVVQILAKAAKTGWENLLYLLAVISTALGLFNLLPIPLVDGGHIFIALLEGILKRPFSRKAIQTANLVGFGIIILIFVFATYSDLARLGLKF